MEEKPIATRRVVVKHSLDDAGNPDPSGTLIQLRRVDSRAPIAIEREGSRWAPT